MMKYGLSYIQYVPMMSDFVVGVGLCILILFSPLEKKMKPIKLHWGKICPKMYETDRGPYMCGA